MAFTLPPLPYDFGALEPYIDAQTMELHHDRHHATYVEKLNEALSKHPRLAGQSITDLIKNLATLPDDIKTAVRNNGGGHLNHSLFWKMMMPKAMKEPRGIIKELINHQFGSFAQFQEQFNAAAKTVFGSGWAWLVLDKGGAFKIVSTPNQDNPITQDMHPILGLDVWEHAYYLKYQNKRPDYINAWWHVINWEQVEENYREVAG